MDGSRTLRELLDEVEIWRVRAARGTGKARVPLRDLAVASGVPRSSLAKYLAGTTVMPADVLDAVVLALGAGPEQAREWAAAWEEAMADHMRADHLRTDRKEPEPEPEPQSEPARARGPWQLPADTGLFTGRSGEVETLLGLAAQTSGAVVISAIDGMGGIGKTSLAVHAGHLLAERFPGGALFLELHTHTVGVAARSAFDVQGGALVALGAAPQGIPADPDARAAAYRNRLAGTRTLIVVDDARDESQVRTLLPGTGGCLVLVTSRNRLKALDDAEALRLDVLARGEAVELFCKTAGAGRADADDPAVARIVRLCGNLPMAVRIAGALLRARPAWTVQHLLSDLTTNLAGLEAFDDGQRRLRTVFDASYRNLPDDAQVLFRRLGQIPGPDGDAYAAAALLDCDPRTAGRLLGLLADRSMLTEHSAGRWRMHDLLREQAHALTGSEDTAEERNAALDRLLHYYAHTAQTASGPIARLPRPAPEGPAPAHAPDVSDAQAAQAWLRTEYPNLDAAFTHARTHRLDHHTIALTAGLAQILVVDGPWARALELHQAAARTSPDHSADRAYALSDLGRLRNLTGDFPGSVEAQTQALMIHEQLGNSLGVANSLNELGRARDQTADYQGSVEAQTRALEIYRQIGNRAGEAAALNDLGRALHLTGDHQGSVDAQTQALEIYHEIGNRLGEANALNYLGGVQYSQGELAASADAQERALEIYQELGHRRGEANALTDLGMVRLSSGDFAGSCEAHLRAVDICRQLGSRFGEANALTELGRARCLAGDYAGSSDVQVRALEIYRELGHRGCEAYALNFHAATIAGLGDRPAALAMYRQALEMTRELHQPDDEAISLEGIADHYLHLAAGSSEGISYLNQALEIYQRLGMRLDVERVQARLSKASKQ